MASIQHVKYKLRQAVRSRGLSYSKMNMDSDWWGPAARANTWRLTKRLNGKGQTSLKAAKAVLYPPALRIIPKDYKWARPLVDRGHEPGGVVWHNAAATSCTADQIHSWHLSNGWSGIAYHFFVDKEGRVFRGRPEGKLGGHTLNYSTWLGVCTEGNFDKERMGDRQLAACIQLRKYLDVKYDKPRHKRHRDMPGNSTSCPGRYFPFVDITRKG
jgi:hypothetical protein